MAVERIGGHLCQGVTPEVVAERATQFFLEQGYQAVKFPGGLQFERGRLYPQLDPHDYRRRYTLRIQPARNGARVQVECRVEIPRALVMGVDRLYWDLEWRVLRAALDGGARPFTWVTTYQMYRRNHNRLSRRWARMFTLVFTLLLSIGVVAWYLLGLTRWGVGGALLSFLFTLIVQWMLSGPFVVEHFFPVTMTADQLWEQVMLLEEAHDH